MCKLCKNVLLSLHWVFFNDLAISLTEWPDDHKNLPELQHKQFWPSNSNKCEKAYKMGRKNIVEKSMCTCISGAKNSKTFLFLHILA